MDMKKVLITFLLVVLVSGCGVKEEASINVNGDMGNGVEVDVAGVVSDDAECVKGSWMMVNFSEYLVASVNSNVGDLVGNVESSDTGQLIISFDDKNMVMTDENFEVTMTMMGISVPVEVDANGTASYEVKDGVLYNLSSSGKVEGAVENDNSGQVNGAAQTVNFETFAARAVDIECEGDDLTWLAGDNFAIDLKFERL